MIKHNRSLQTFIDNADSVIHNAKSPQDLVELIEAARLFKGNFKFNQRDYYLYFTLNIITFLVSFTFFLETQEGFLLFIAGLSGILGFILISRFLRRCRAVNAIAQKIFYRDLLFDQQLEPIHSPEFSITALNSRFTDFNRGNHSREIWHVLKGTHTHDSGEFPFHYYQFHYVDEHITEEVDKDGKKTSKSVLEHHDRFGFIVPLEGFNFDSKIDHPHTFPVLIIKKRQRRTHKNPSDYLPASLEFRDKLQVKASAPHIAAKFLKPRVVECLLTMNKQLQDMQIELADNHSLLIAFNNDYLRTPTNQFDLNHVDDFLAEINAITEIPEFRDSLDKIAIILNESDNNF